MPKHLETVRSYRTERHEETQYSFLLNLHSLMKGTYTNLHTQHPYKFPSVPIRTSNKKNVLILLNKLTSQGAVRYLIIKHGKLWCVCSGGTDIYM